VTVKGDLIRWDIDLIPRLATDRGVQTPAQKYQAEADTRKLPKSASSG
jgi:hypothetical protein